MIPTRSRSKLPKALSYPIGAEAISEALADAPHADEMSLSFYDHPEYTLPKGHPYWYRTIRSGLPYLILTVEYQAACKPGLSANNSMIERGWYQEHWNLTVCPVLRELRQVAGRLIREQGLPAVVEWLRSSSRIGWDARRHQIRLVFNPADGTLSIAREDGV